jgi:hypothetical protein
MVIPGHLLMYSLLWLGSFVAHKIGFYSNCASSNVQRVLQLTRFVSYTSKSEHTAVKLALCTRQTRSSQVNKTWISRSSRSIGRPEFRPLTLTRRAENCTKLFLCPVSFWHRPLLLLILPVFESPCVVTLENALEAVLPILLLVLYSL